MCSVCILTHSYIQHYTYTNVYERHTNDAHNTTHTHEHTHAGSDARLSTCALGIAAACKTVKRNEARPLHGEVWSQTTRMCMYV
jgi:hypothetical protein